MAAHDQSDECPAGAVSDRFDPLLRLLEARVLEPPQHPGELARLGRYVIARWIGQGGMGLVLEGRDPDKGRQVAIKLLKPELSADPVARHAFAKEGNLASALEHPHILPIFDVVGERLDGPYLVMPLIAGGSLAQYLHAHAPLPVDEALLLAHPIAEALSFAHGKGIIHRDIKPANVLLDGKGGVYVADFGLVRTVFNDSMLDPTRSACVGTPAYMSPGVAAGVAEDTRCDIYSFGALLYELLAGRPPYAGRDAAEVLRQVREAPPMPLAVVQPAVPGALVRMVEGCMARELRDRYAEMRDVVADLERFIRGLHVQGPHGHRGLPPLTKMQRAAATAAGIVLVATLVMGLCRALHRNDRSGIIPSRSDSNTVAGVSPAPTAQLPALQAIVDLYGRGETNDATLMLQERRTRARRDLREWIDAIERHYRAAAADTHTTFRTRPRIIALESGTGSVGHEGSDDTLVRLVLEGELAGRHGLRVVEREALDQVLRELHIGSSALADPRASPGAGRVLTAGLLLLTEVEPDGAGETVTLRLVDTETTGLLGVFDARRRATEDLAAVCRRLADEVTGRIVQVKPLIARVAGVEGKRVHAEIGRFHGLAEGARFRVVQVDSGSESESDARDGKTLGIARALAPGDTRSAFEVEWSEAAPPGSPASLWLREDGRPSADP